LASACQVETMIDIDIITGFLGAGKTTFANILLRHYLSEGKRAVFVVNEFGKTALDAEIIKREGFEAVALSNGCICCTLKDDLVLSLQAVIRSFYPEKIVFETSGIFIFDQFRDILKDDFLKKHCRIARTITIIDSIHFKKEMLMAGSFISNQVKNSSVLVISKTEKFKGDMKYTLDELRRTNPYAGIISLQWGDEKFITEVLGAAGKTIVSADCHSHAHIDSLTVQLRKDFTSDAFGRLKDELVSGNFGEIIRVKGYIRIDGADRLLNVAMNDLVLEKVDMDISPSLTFVGNKINKKKLCDILNC
jgi:G3E family GTPase